MAVPRYFELHKPFLECLKDGQIRTLKEIRTQVSESMNLKKEDFTEKLPSGRQSIFDNRIGWARTYLKKAEIIESSNRANFNITKRGHDVLRDNPLVIDVAYLERFEAFKEFVRPFADTEKVPGDREGNKHVVFGTPDDNFEEAFKQKNRV